MRRHLLSRRFLRTMAPRVELYTAYESRLQNHVATLFSRLGTPWAWPASEAYLGVLTVIVPSSKHLSTPRFLAWETLQCRPVELLGRPGMQHARST